MLTRRQRSAGAPSHRVARSLVVAAGLLAGACSTAEPPAAEPPVTATSPTSAAPGTTAAPPGTAVEPLDGIGEDDAFPDLGTPTVDVDDYDLALDFDPATGSLDATATLRLTATTEVEEVELDLQGLTVERATVDGEQAPHEQQRDKLVIDLPGPTEPGDELTVVVDYGGTPEPVPTAALDGVEVGWHTGPEGSMVLSEPEGASTWYPVNNHPLDKATYTFRVTVPEPYSAVANGELVSTDADAAAGTTTFEWRMDAPMASYLASVVTGELTEVDGGEHDGVAYSYWYPVGTEPSAALERSDREVAELAERLGPFPFDTYGGVIYLPSYLTGDAATERFLSGVALEVQGRSLFAEGTTIESVVVHEAAHQWMGDSVSITDWSRDIWWVEGFAHFAEYLDDLDELADRYPEVRAEWLPPGDIPVDELFFGCSYECGAMVFYALHQEVGEDTFWAILQEFTARYRHANASTDDLVAVASEVSGEDLTDFFDAWLFADTPPRLPS